MTYLVNADFKKRNIQDWDNMLHNLFGEKIKNKSAWTSIYEINRILNILSNNNETQKILNHAIYPDGGGLDIIGSKISDHANCIEINMNGIPNICMPERLIFTNNFNEPEWCYFVLELKSLPQIGFYSEDYYKKIYHEDLNESSYGFEPYNDGYSKYEKSRHVLRLIKGKIMIVPKSSFYNRIAETYDGIHNRVVDLEEYISSIRDASLNIEY